MKRISISLFLLIALSLSCFVYALADSGIDPYASQDIASVSVSLLSNKSVSYLITPVDLRSTVKINSCSLYKKNGDSWEYVTSMKNAIPSSKVGVLSATCNASSYITSSGTYRVTVSITVNSTTVSKTTNQYTFN